MNKHGIDRLVKLGMLTALSIVVLFIPFLRGPFFFLQSASYLEYDMADVPILIGTFLYGPWWGLALTGVVSVLQWLLVSPGGIWIGAVMHFCATGVYVLSAGLLYRRNRTRGGAIFGMGVGGVLQVLTMIPLNLLLTPLFFQLVSGIPRETGLAIVLAALPTAIIPFNAIKTVVNSLITFLLYKRVAKALKFELIK